MDPALAFVIFLLAVICFGMAALSALAIVLPERLAVFFIALGLALGFFVFMADEWEAIDDDDGDTVATLHEANGVL